ncbi:MULTISPECIES: GNAT family N-acetyltransferase [unclassified Pseudodesulfovibrio]|uniref:GNAT family N-acetyltransferase n=1 Tax=unclassified Pseudodesulfovibrio TaxID=2661612 RepID=UPI000FEC097F|nr:MULTISPECIES: GNAT family N-acetyltransferase [unclassified Pseudodesulfovibrio]MCJ2165903.1 GNAT family N-acetyltransferase [Pseudodesulfovibrio sp. S3-i]RWU02664.1 GNAT family N-acetyltransferase [Pseudodesulfovibrio sp. S3]
MYITAYADHDTDAIVELITGIQIGEFGVATSAEKQPDLRDIPGFYQQGAGNFWLAFEGDELVGTIALKDVGDGVCALRKMFVKKEYRGKERGVAVALMQTLLSWARSNGVREIYLGTVDIYHAAHRFYEKNGFTEVSPGQVPESVPFMEVDVKFYRYCF